MKFRNFVSHYWKSVIFISVILYLSFAPPSTFKGVPTFENEDKLVHLFLYFVLTCILIFDFRQFAKNNQMSILSFVIICILFPVILGGIVEIIQPIYFPPRTADWFDWFSDIMGVFVGWFGMSIMTHKSVKRNIK